MIIFNEIKAEQFLSKYLKINNSKVTKNVKETQDFIKKFKYPVVLKIISNQALHKSKINGVRIVNDDKELKFNYEDLLKLAKKQKLNLDGILIQSYITGKEVIIGGKKDNAFGQIILFGHGGIFTENLKDFSIRICPVNENEVYDMIKETKIYKELKNKEIRYISNSILKVNEILVKNQNITELDINPMIINDKGAFVVDARMAMN